MLVQVYLAVLRAVYKRLWHDKQIKIECPTDLCKWKCFQSQSTLEGVDEVHEFARLKQSMEMVGFSPETQRKYAVHFLFFSPLTSAWHLFTHVSI